jgi:hypothetical protein
VQPQRPTQPPQQQPQRGTPPPQRPTQPVSQRPVPAAQPQQQAQRPSQPVQPQRGAQFAVPQRDAPQQGQAVRLSQPRQQVIVTEQQQQLVTYDTHLVEQQRAGSQWAVQLQQQNRSAGYSFQLLYVANLHEQQMFIQNRQGYDYYSDPYYYTAPNYRYLRGGRYYEINSYGADVLRQAVNYGYHEGLECGQADQQDRWAFNYQDSYAYRDGNYGYTGFYVDQGAYNYYFRQGFERGYDDAYYSRQQYGEHMGEQYSVTSSVMGLIFRVEAIR